MVPSMDEIGLRLVNSGTYQDSKTGKRLKINSPRVLLDLTRIIYNNFHLYGASPSPIEPFERQLDRDFSPLLDRSYYDLEWSDCDFHNGCVLKSGIHLKKGEYTIHRQNCIAVKRCSLHLNASWGWHSFTPSHIRPATQARLYISGKNEITSIAEIVDCLTLYIEDRWRLKFSYMSMQDRPDAITVYLSNTDLNTLLKNSPQELRFCERAPGFSSIQNNLAYASLSSNNSSQSFGWKESKKLACRILSNELGDSNA